MPRPPCSLFDVVAEQVVLVTPHTKRITVDGSCLSPFRDDLPTQWLKVLVQGDQHWARLHGSALRSGVEEAGLDFVLHGDDGPASAARVKPGNSIKISGTHPRGGFVIEQEAAHYLVFGDETALPAIAGILESLPANVRVDGFIEVADVSEEQTIESAASVNLIWLHRKSDANSRLVDAARGSTRSYQSTTSWIAAESTVVAALRKVVFSEWGFDRSRLHAAG